MSLFLILIYITIVASTQYPLILKRFGIDPQTVNFGPLAGGFFFALALFASVLLHELGHVFMARRLGRKVHGITLWMLGGVSEIEEIPNTRYGELKVAVIGPFVSLAFGALLLFISTHIQSPDWIVLTGWLGSSNIVLGIFNLLPAFPLDGGRVLRSLLSERYGEIRGTEKAVRVSQGFAIVLGILGFMGLNFLLMFIALFIYMAAQSEWMIRGSQERLQGMTVGQVGIHTDTVVEDDLIRVAASRMLKSKSAVLPVRTTTQKPAIISIEGVTSIPREEWNTIRVRQILQEARTSVDVNLPLDEAFKELINAPVHTLPMTDAGVLVGVIRLQDVLEAGRLKELEGVRNAGSKRAA